MTTTKTEELFPVGPGDYPIPPGDIIAEAAQISMIPPQQLAEELKLSAADLGRLLCGELAVDTQIASNLERILGQTRDHWLSLEQLYRDALLRVAAAAPMRKRA